MYIHKAIMGELLFVLIIAVGTDPWWEHIHRMMEYYTHIW